MLNLDTDIAVEFLRRNQAVVRKLASFRYHTLTGTALGELMVGAKKSSAPTISLASISRLVETVGLVFPDSNTSSVYADIRVALERKGTPIPQNDIWIAAISLQYRIPIASNDAHFGHVDGLELVRFKP